MNQTIGSPPTTQIHQPDEYIYPTRKELIETIVDLLNPAFTAAHVSPDSRKELLTQVGVLVGATP